VAVQADLHPGLMTPMESADLAPDTAAEGGRSRAAVRVRVPAVTVAPQWHWQSTEVQAQNDSDQ
jgi:hypothetical protein